MPVRGGDALTRVRIEPALVDDLAEPARPAARAQVAHRLRQGPAHHVRRPRGGRPRVVGDEVGVRGREPDLLDADPEQLGGEQRDRVDGALAHLGRRAADHVGAVLLRLDRDRRAARRLHPLEDHAQPLAVPVLAPADRLGRGLQALGEMDVVHRLAGAVAVSVAEDVPQAQLERIEAELLGQEVHRPLGGPGRLHLAVAPEGAVRRQVGVDAVGVDADVRDAVGPGRGEAHLLRHAGPAVGVRAGVGVAGDLLRQQRPVRPRAELHLDDRGVPVQGLPLLVPGKHELDRAAGLAGERRGDRLGPKECLRPERAAHRRADDANLLELEAEDAGELLSEVERRLRARVHLEPAAVPAGETGVRLHCSVLRRGRREGLLDDDVRRGEAGLDVAVPDPETVADVRSRLGPQSEVGDLARGDLVRVVDEGRLRPHRLEDVEHGRQLLVVHLDERRRLLRRPRRIGRDGGDRVARIARPVDREHALVADLDPVPGEAAHVVRREHDAVAGQRRRIHR